MKKKLNAIITMKSYFIALTCLACIVSGCTSSLKKENQALRAEIEQRREALEAKQNSELEAARQAMAETDSLLTAVSREHDELHEWVMAHSSQMNDHSPEVIRLNTLRARRDSLNVEYQVLAAKIKHILYLQEQEE